MGGPDDGRFKLEDGAIVDTDRAAKSWEEATEWDGRNHISKATGDQFKHETLYTSKKGQYYIAPAHNGRAPRIAPKRSLLGTPPRCCFKNEHELAADLASFEEEIIEW